MSTDIRAWGDQYSPAMQKSVGDSIIQARTTYGDKEPAELLAISGGGANGAFGAGILCGWTAHGDRPKFRLVTGVSAGAILAPFAFVGSEYDPELKEIATTVTNDKVFSARGFFAIFYSDSLTDTAPLVKFLEKYYDRKLLRAVAAEHAKGRRLFVATTDLDAERPVIWDMGAIAAHDTPEALALFRQVILASAAIPALFPPVYLKVKADGKEYDEMHVDGGTTAQVVLYGNVLSIPDLQRENRVPATGDPIKVYIIPQRQSDSRAARRRAADHVDHGRWCRDPDQSPGGGRHFPNLQFVPAERVPVSSGIHSR